MTVPTPSADRSSTKRSDHRLSCPVSRRDGGAGERSQGACIDAVLVRPGRTARVARVGRAWVALALVATLNASAPAALAQSRSGRAPVDLVERGRQLFEDQRYEESIQTLSGALVRPNSGKTDKVEMYRLLALDHITLGDNEEAESFVRALLALQPTYELPERESPRFLDFFAKVRARWESEGRPGLITDESALKPVRMRHRSPPDAPRESALVLTAQIDDPDHRVASVKLFFRGGSSGKFAEETTPYDPTQGAARGILPARAVRPPFVAYYLLANDKNGVPLASSGDADAPLRIPVQEGERSWVLPAAISGGIVGVAGIILGALALGGVFK